jgi:flagellar hook-associated protein 2
VYQLMLTAKDTGIANGFTVTGMASLTGGTGVTFGANTQDAADAEFTVNGLQITSTSNIVDDVIPGATLTLKDEVTATITVERDVDEAQAVVQKFVTAYNDLVKFAKDQNLAAIGGKASIARDPVLQGFRSSIGNALRESYAIGGSLTALGMVGVGFDLNGNMTIDSEAFEDAMGDAPMDVQKLFSGTDGTGGVFGTLSALIGEYTEAGGLVADAQQRIDDQVSAISKRLDSMEAMLELRRTTLQKEYIAADLAMSRINSQSGQLSALGGQFRLF